VKCQTCGGRYPRWLILEPIRELAKQVTNDFISIKSRYQHFMMEKNILDKNYH
jgi:superfamily II DNA/RNA helicase